jgi:hypothetical protein
MDDLTRIANELGRLDQPNVMAIQTIAYEQAECCGSREISSKAAGVRGPLRAQSCARRQLRSQPSVRCIWRPARRRCYTPLPRESPGAPGVDSRAIMVPTTAVSTRRQESRKLRLVGQHAAQCSSFSPSPPVTIRQSQKCQYADRDSAIFYDRPEQARVTNACCPFADCNHCARNPECHRACSFKARPMRLLRAGSRSTHLVFRPLYFFTDVTNRIGD